MISSLLVSNKYTIMDGQPVYHMMQQANQIQPRRKKPEQNTFFKY